MKATLEFDLTDVDDIQKHRACIAAEDLINCVWEFMNQTRKGVEEFVIEANLTPDETIDHIYDVFTEILESYHINIDSLRE